MCSGALLVGQAGRPQSGYDAHSFPGASKGHVALGENRIKKNREHGHKGVFHRADSGQEIFICIRLLVRRTE